MKDMALVEKSVRNKFSALFDKDKVVEDAFKKIKTGTATYDDAQLFAESIGDILRQSFSSLIDEVGVDIDLELLADDVVAKMLEGNYRLSSLVCDVVQDNLNKAAGLGIKPKAPGLDKTRIEGITTLVKRAENENALRNALGEKVVNLTQSYVDDWVKTNADFQANLGMEPMIVRKWSGSYPSHDTKHTDWCEKLAGVYRYPDVPKNVFARHEGCRCTVSYYPEGSTKGKITALKKGEKDTNQVLWNTGTTLALDDDGVVRRRVRNNPSEEANKIING